jgi:hypothetical protein
MNKLWAGIFVLVMAFSINYFFLANTADTDDGTTIYQSNNSSSVSHLSNSMPMALPQSRASSADQIDENLVEPKNETVQPTQRKVLDHDKKKRLEEKKVTHEAPFTLDEVLLNIPQDYHSIFSWRTGQEDKLIQEYGQLQVAQQIETYQYEQEKQISSFIFQHEQGNFVQIERLNCTQNSCEIFGLAEMSNSWSDIERDMSNAPWWSFSSSTSHNGVSENGQMVFMTLFYK